MRSEKLSPKESCLYGSILAAANENRLATVEEMYLAVYGLPLPDSRDEISDKLSPVLSRLRAKLPKGEIVAKHGLGYHSRSATEIED